VIGTAIAAALGVEIVGATPVGGGDICRAYRVELGTGERLFAKTRDGAPDGFFAAEAAGLQWLAEASGGPHVPGVRAVTAELIALDWVDHGAPTAAAAERLGRQLAVLHRTGADTFGWRRDGFIGRLPLDNTPAETWPEFFAERRLRPYLRQATDLGAMAGGDVSAVDRVIDRIDELAGPPEPPARLHGDLWSGNLLWGTAGRVWLVDPAAHGGHRESDLAMLTLFGAPMLGRTLAAYQETVPLADGWRDRMALHQLCPLLVHAVHFGGSYGARAGLLARTLVGTRD
jgi:fructosamine-3-kinase